MSQLLSVMLPIVGGLAGVIGWARDSKWLLAMGVGLVSMVITLRVFIFAVSKGYEHIECVLCPTCRDRTKRMIAAHGWEISDHK